MRKFITILAMSAMAFSVFGVLPAIAATPTLTLAPNPVTPGNPFSVNGSGFTPSPSTAGTTPYKASVTVNFPSPPAAQTVDIDTNGNFANLVYFTVPSGTPAGNYTVTATENSNPAVTATATLAVGSNATLSTTASTVAAGSQVTVNGTGCTASSQCYVQMTVKNTAGANETVGTVVTANSSGAFTATLTVPSDAAAGTATVNAYQGSSATGTAFATTTFTVTVNTTITINPTTATAGTTTSVTLTGQGFGPSETVNYSYTANLTTGTSQVVQGSVTTDANGNFSTTMSVPSNIVPGTYAITVQGVNSGKHATTNLTVTGTPAITISPASVTPGNLVTITGQLFAPNQTVNITATVPTTGGTSTTLTGTVTASSTGTFTSSLFIPSNASAGTVTITATEPNAPGGQVSASGTVQIKTYTASITASPQTNLSNTIVTVNGSGFAPGPNNPVTITATFNLVGGGTQPVSAVRDTDTTGSFTGAQILIPSNAAAGSVTITASQAAGAITATTVILVQSPTPASISVSPATATAGTTGSVTVSGQGFGASETVTYSYSANLTGGTTQTVQGSATTDANGNFSGTLSVPSNIVAGAYSIAATGATSGKHASSTLTLNAAATPVPTFTPTPTASPTPTSKPSPEPGPKSVNVYFRQVSLWWHTVREGTFDHLEVQATPKIKLGIWVHVIFPSGKHFDYFEHTNGAGHWRKSFDIPFGTISRYSNKGHIELQLWHGKNTRKDFLPFVIIP